MSDDSKYSEIKALIEKVTGCEASRIVPIYEEIRELGFKHGLVYKRTIAFGQVGAHRKNREGAMVSGQEAMNIWDDVDRVGVCTDLFKDATAFEEPASRINETEFLRRCATDKYLRDYKAGDIQVSSVACTHWNQALGAAEVAMARL